MNKICEYEGVAPKEIVNLAGVSKKAKHVRVACPVCGRRMLVRKGKRGIVKK
jgi:ssDNA-binding Zn-finger/Zn-ribbon topoisomerase 1